jgi:outer membrane lipoprotein-sorting protein
MWKNSCQPVAILGLLLFVVGCAHAPSQTHQSPDALLNYACSPGSSVQTVKGTVWMKAQSKDASGQFPASVKAKAPDHLKVEAINLLGATQAVITVDGKSYSVQVPTKSGLKQREQGLNSWSGIPLQWATDLFLGRIPCPSSAKQDIEITDKGDLKITTGASQASEDPETFIYHFKSVGGHAWPETLHWERKGPFANQVDFQFDDPDTKSLSPKKWEAKSAQGEVKVRWRDRVVTP